MLLHLHIPRTGGKSVVKWMRQLLPSQDSAYSFSNYQVFWDDILGRSQKPCEVSRVRFVTGHFHYGLDQYFASDSAYIIVLRNPVDRVKSIIRYIRKNKEHRLHMLFSKANKIDHIYSNLKHSPQISNGQVRQLCCYDTAGLICLNETHADKAMSRIANNKVHVTITEELDDFMCSAMGKSNINAITHENSAECDETSMWLDCEDADSVIRENNQLDMRLYEFAKQHRCTDPSVLISYVLG